MKLEKKTVSVIMLALLLISMLTLAFNIQQVKESGTVATKSFGTSELVPILDTFTTVMESGTTSWDTVFIGSPFVLLDGGLYKMWYMAASEEPWPLRWVIAYAESSDGIVWSNKQVAHDAGSAYYETMWPWVLKEDGVYRMWHADYYEWVAGDWSWYIAHMTSTDGINWPAFMSTDDQKVLSALGQSVPQGDGYCVDAPCVVYELGIGYTMWYSVSDHPQPGMGGPSKIWRTTSNDGVTWSNRQLSLPYIPNTWEENVAGASVVKEDDGTYTLFYNAWFTDGTGEAIGVAKSTDGITWTERKQFLRASDLGVNVNFYFYGLVHFEDVDGKRYLYFAYVDMSNGKYNLGRIQLAAFPQTPDFHIVVSPSTGTTAPGTTVTTDVYVSAIAGYDYLVSLSASGQPEGMTTNFNPNTGTPTFTSTMTIQVGDSVPPDIYLITVTGLGSDDTTHSTTYTLTVTTEAVPEFPFGVEVATAIGLTAAVAYIWTRKRKTKPTIPKRFTTQTPNPDARPLMCRQMEDPNSQCNQ